MVQQHFVRLYVRDAEARCQRGGLHAVLRAEAQHFETLVDSLDARRLARSVGCNLSDDLSETRIRIAAAVELEHGIARTGMSVRQGGGSQEFHAGIIDIGARPSRLWPDQKPQPHRRGEYPVLRFRLCAR